MWRRDLEKNRVREREYRCKNRSIVYSSIASLQQTDRIPLDHPFLDPFLKWWTKPTNVHRGRPIQSPPPQLAIYTDASTSGWGAHCGNQSAAGLWSAAETTRHINELELLATQKAVLHFLPLIRGMVVMIHSENGSAVAYLQNQGGTHSLPMFHLTWEILTSVSSSVSPCY